jgi:hypothetical protein
MNPPAEPVGRGLDLGERDIQGGLVRGRIRGGVGHAVEYGPRRAFTLLACLRKH